MEVPLVLLASFFRAAAALPAPLTNPANQGRSWYHGTSHGEWREPYEDAGTHVKDDLWGHVRHEEGQPHDDWPGGDLSPPDRFYGSYGDHYNDHWNTDLGVHFTSQHTTARKFADPGYHDFDTRVAHCRLHIGNPKRYRSEFDMARHAIEWAHENGFHYLSKENRENPRAVKDHINDGGYFSTMPGEHEESRDRMGYLDDVFEDREPMAHSVMAVDRGEHRGNPYFFGKHLDHYLMLHPERPEIVEGFKKHLQDQGHDGITYGNEYEEPQGHTCAIAFHPDQIHLHRWEWLHPESEYHQPKHKEMPGQYGIDSTMVGGWARGRGRTSAVLPGYQREHEWLPDKRIFAPGKGTLDPRLFDSEQQMHTEVSTIIFERLDHAWSDFEDWRSWSRVYLAGSEASEWWGNNDFDTLIGVNYAHARRVHDIFADMDDEQISVHLTTILRRTFNDEDWVAPWDGEVWHLTGFVNPNSWDIRKIKPYAAYDMSNRRWAVKPPHLDETWGPGQWAEGTWDQMESYVALVKAIDSLPEPDRTRQGAALFDFLHNDRKRAFGPEGYGWRDPGNAVWKSLDMHPNRPLEKLVNYKRRQIKGEHLEAAA